MCEEDTCLPWDPALHRCKMRFLMAVQAFGRKVSTGFASGVFLIMAGGVNVLPRILPVV